MMIQSRRSFKDLVNLKTLKWWTSNLVTFPKFIWEQFGMTLPLFKELACIYNVLLDTKSGRVFRHAIEQWAIWSSKELQTPQNGTKFQIITDDVLKARTCAAVSIMFQKARALFGRVLKHHHKTFTLRNHHENGGWFVLLADIIWIFWQGLWCN